MKNIEWGESKFYKPLSRRLDNFIKEINVSLGNSPNNEVVIFIERQALEGLNDFLSHDLTREHGGVLLGHSYLDETTRHHYINILSTIPAQDTVGTPVHLQFTPESWSYISGIIEENHGDMVILGWYHSHPGLGVFMSSTDRATQAAFFNNPWNLAVVVDPIARKAGWFLGSACKRVNPLNVVTYDLREKYEVEITQKDEFEMDEEQFNKVPITKYSWLLPFIAISLFTAIGLIGFFLISRPSKITFNKNDESKN